MPRLAGAFFFGQSARVKPSEITVCVRAGHRARWLPEGDATFAAMLALIAKARTEVCLGDLHRAPRASRPYPCWPR